MESDYYNLKHRRLLEDSRRKREGGIALFFTMFFSSLFLFLVGFGYSIIFVITGVIVLLLGILLFIHQDSQSRKFLDKASEMENPPEKTVGKEVESTITDFLIEGISYLMKHD